MTTDMLCSRLAVPHLCLLCYQVGAESDLYLSEALGLEDHPGEGDHVKRPFGHLRGTVSPTLTGAQCW